jgi:hypothetical protein
VAAAPYQLLAKLSQVTTGASHGLVAQLRSGPSIYFGAASQLDAKWAAAAAVLADPGSDGAVYIDVTNPGRPAPGGGSGAGAGTSSATAAGASGTSASTSTGSPGGG